MKKIKCLELPKSKKKIFFFVGSQRLMHATKKNDMHVQSATSTNISNSKYDNWYTEEMCTIRDLSIKQYLEHNYRTKGQQFRK